MHKQTEIYEKREENERTDLVPGGLVLLCCMDEYTETPIQEPKAGAFVLFPC